MRVKFLDTMFGLFIVLMAVLLVWACTLCLTALTYGTYLMFFGSNGQ